MGHRLGWRPPGALAAARCGRVYSCAGIPLFTTLRQKITFMQFLDGGGWPGAAPRPRHQESETKHENNDDATQTGWPDMRSGAAGCGRRLVMSTCPACGAQFNCCMVDSAEAVPVPNGLPAISQSCWCGAFAPVSPLPAAGSDARCFCPECLRKRQAEHH